MSGDKYGEMCVWQYETQARHVWSPHEYLVTSMCWGGEAGDNTVYTGSADGLVKAVDLDTYDSTPLLMLNPLGWQGKPKEWRMVYSLGGGDRCLWAGDDVGNVHIVDPRGGAGGVNGRTVHQFNAHGKGNKVQFVQSNPVAPWLVATCGNDKAARIWDARMLRLPPGARASWPAGGGELWSRHASSTAGAADASCAVVSLLHPRAVNSAVWSPCTGRKLMTTCLDNRIRIWDNPLVLHGVQEAPHVHPTEAAVRQPPSRQRGQGGGATDSEDDDFESSAMQPRAAPAAPVSGAELDLGDAFPPPSSTLIHSHDFGRYLSPFRAQWDPKDSAERLVVCGRYISEDFNGVKLHPIDLLDAARGGAGGPSATVVTQLVDPLVPTICPVNAVSPHEHAVATGSSMSMFVWKPVPMHLVPPPGGGAPPPSSSSAEDEPAPKSTTGHTPWWELPEYTEPATTLEANGGKKGRAGGGKRARGGGDVARSFTAAAAAAAGVPAAPAIGATTPAALLDVLVCSGRDGGVQAYNVVSALNKNKKAAAAKARAARKDTAEARAVKAKAAQQASGPLPDTTAPAAVGRRRTAKQRSAASASPVQSAPGSRGAAAVEDAVVNLVSPEVDAAPAPTPPAKKRRPAPRSSARKDSTPPQRVSPYFSPPPAGAPPVGGADTGVPDAPPDTHRGTPTSQAGVKRARSAANASTQATAASKASTAAPPSPLERFAYGGAGGLLSARRLDRSSISQLQRAEQQAKAAAASVAAVPGNSCQPADSDSSDDSDFADALPAAMLVAKASPAPRR